MQKLDRVTHRFVEFVPAELEYGVLYISIEYATASHLCCCGCGMKVVTPLTPTDWKLVFNGEAVSLHPSIGNWGYKCRSHYWIRNGMVEWDFDWTGDEIAEGRKWDRQSKQHHYRAHEPSGKQPASNRNSSDSWLRKLWGRLQS